MTLNSRFSCFRIRIGKCKLLAALSRGRANNTLEWRTVDVLLPTRMWLKRPTQPNSICLELSPGCNVTRFCTPFFSKSASFCFLSPSTLPRTTNALQNEISTRSDTYANLQSCRTGLPGRKTRRSSSSSFYLAGSASVVYASSSLTNATQHAVTNKT